MPFVNKHIRFRFNPSNITFTIPVVFYQNTFNIISQIISDDLYFYLLDSPFSSYKIPSGDFLINSIPDISTYFNTRNQFYSLPPLPACAGGYVLASISISKLHSFIKSFQSSLNREIILYCAGKSILSSFTNSISATFSPSIGINLEHGII